MTDVKQFFKSQGPKLLPFFVFVIIYFAFVRDPVGELWTTLLKCAPIVCLMLYIVLNGINLTKDSKYSLSILLGLIFSCGGDALLNMDLFPHGMGSFALAQICYIIAFGFKPLKLLIAVPLYLAGAAFVAIVYKDLDDVLVVGLPVYVTLLLTMCWRSLARAVDRKCFLAIFCAVGSVFFVISDGLIAVDMFLIKVPNARIWIMTTYYLAQFAIALSTANELAKKKSPKNFKGRNNSARRHVKSN
ncbi:lysoplasmalogenase TMEM86A [Calliphora vicina]|uniref:lysoplasmalogenase TMEM86A n=1 Tax=Calliphora vicina TaxID=7373 RepID=UPI00325B4EB0